MKQKKHIGMEILTEEEHDKRHEELPNHKGQGYLIMSKIFKQKILKEIKKDINEIDKDERYHYPPADVFSNAPLALVQMGMKGRMSILKKYKELLEKKE